MGSFDNDGYLSITGRLKETIIRGGENICPRENRRLPLYHPDVAEVAVFGVPDETYGEEVMAWIQPLPGRNPSTEGIRDYCRGRMAHYKVPKYITLVTEFPMTVTGKFREFRMRDLAIQQMATRAS